MPCRKVHFKRWYGFGYQNAQPPFMRELFETDHTEIVEILNDLAELNMDRILGYELALSELGNKDAGFLEVL